MAFSSPKDIKGLKITDQFCLFMFPKTSENLLENSIRLHYLCQSVLRHSTLHFFNCLLTGDLLILHIFYAGVRNPCLDFVFCFFDGVFWLNFLISLHRKEAKYTSFNTIFVTHFFHVPLLLLSDFFASFFPFVPFLEFVKFLIKAGSKQLCMIIYN